jgi:PAS domain-containing protein
MSFVTTEPEMESPAAAMSDVGLLGECTPDYGGATADGDRRVDRRRTRQSKASPMDFLRDLSALVVLERIPVPSLAMAPDGMIVFANAAFAEMVGYRQEVLAGSAFPEIFRTVPAAVCALPGNHLLANLVVDLQHWEGWTVRARMTRSTLMRCDDPVVLITFEDLTERLWTDE